jgi:hypothetical protein
MPLCVSTVVLGGGKISFLTVHVIYIIMLLEIVHHCLSLLTIFFSEEELLSSKIYFSCVVWFILLFSLLTIYTFYCGARRVQFLFFIVSACIIISIGLITLAML